MLHHEQRNQFRFIYIHTFIHRCIIEVQKIKSWKNLIYFLALSLSSTRNSI